MSKGKGFVTGIANTMAQVKSELQRDPIQKDGYEHVIKVDPNLISNWEFRDRQHFELGDIDELAVSIETKGQAQPIIVVYADDIFKSRDSTSCKYIVIAGYRRWLACRLKSMTVDVIVRKMTFEQAIACLVSENEKETVSDYSKGMFYYSLLKKEGVSKKVFYEKLGMNRGVFDNYLSFAEVPKEVWDAVKDMRNISARTSATIKSLCQKGENEIRAIISIADKIASGIGEKRINALVNKILSSETVNDNNATRVAFTKDIFIDVKEDSVVVTAKKIGKEDLFILREKFNEILENYIKENKQVMV